MKFRLMALFAVLVAAPVVGSKPDDEDPVAVQLLKDKEAFTMALSKAKSEALKGFDKQYETVKASKSLKVDVQIAQLEKIEAEKKAFDETGAAPTLPGLKAVLTTYQAAQKKAEAQCKAGFEKAARAYRDKGDLKTAGAVLEEMKEFMAKVPGASGTGAVGAVVINCAVSGKVLGLQNGATEDGTKVVTADYAKGDLSQHWKIVPATDGWVYVENVKTGSVMTANGKGNGTEVTIAKKAQPANENQLWKVTPVEKMKDAVKVFAKPSGKLIGVDAKSKDAGARILLWMEQGNEPAQIFSFVTPK